MTLELEFLYGQQPTTPTAPLPDNLFRVKHDIERPAEFMQARFESSIPTVLTSVLRREMSFAEAWDALWRSNVPEVYFFEPVHKVEMTADWQFMMWELFLHGAPNLSGDYAIKKWTEVYGCHRAFTNFSGFECKKPEPHGPFANYIAGTNLGRDLPKLDKPRVCGGATITGRVSGGYLYVETLTEPVDIEWLAARPWLYFHATTVHKDGTIGRFPQGDGSPVLIPLIATQEVRYPLQYLERVTEIADPYWIP